MSSPLPGPDKPVSSPSGIRQPAGKRETKIIPELVPALQLCKSLWSLVDNCSVLKLHFKILLQFGFWVFINNELITVARPSRCVPLFECVTLNLSGVLTMTVCVTPASGGPTQFVKSLKQSQFHSLPGQAQSFSKHKDNRTE